MKQSHLSSDDLGVEKMELSLDFIAVLIVGEGTCYWTKIAYGYKRPVFALRMHVRDFDLVANVRDSLGVTREKVYEYTHNNRHYAFLIVRDIDDIKDIIIPSLWPRLTGYKKEQFKEWFHIFGSADAHPQFRFIYDVFKTKFPELYQ